MHRALVVFPLLFESLTTSLFCQTNPVESYYLSIHQAEMKLIMTDTATSLMHYEDAFRKIFPFLSDLNTAITTIDSYSGNKVDSIAFVKNRWHAIRDYWYPEEYFLNHFVDSVVTSLKHYYSYLDEKTLIKNTKQSQFIIELIQLQAIDQSIRAIKRNDCKDTLLAEFDQKHLNELLHLFALYGWPKPSEFGRASYLILPILLHGTYAIGISESLRSMLISQVRTGNLNAHFYAKLIDRYMDWKRNTPQLYGEWHTTVDGNISIENIQTLDERRSAIFLEPYSEYCFKYKTSFPILFQKE